MQCEQQLIQIMLMHVMVWDTCCDVFRPLIQRPCCRGIKMMSILFQSRHMHLVWACLSNLAFVRNQIVPCGVCFVWWFVVWMDDYNDYHIFSPFPESQCERWFFGKSGCISREDVTLEHWSFVPAFGFSSSCVITFLVFTTVTAVDITFYFPCKSMWLLWLDDSWT